MNKIYAVEKTIPSGGKVVFEITNISKPPAESTNPTGPIFQLGYRLSSEREFKACGYSFMQATLYFNGLKIGKTRVDGIKIPQKILEDLKAEKAEFDEECSREGKRVLAFRPHNVRFAVGGDDHRVYVVTDEIRSNIAIPQVVEDLQICLRMPTVRLGEIRNLSIPLGEISGFYSHPGQPGWFGIETSKLEFLLKDEMAELARRRAGWQGEPLSVSVLRCRECGAAEPEVRFTTMAGSGYCDDCV